MRTFLLRFLSIIGTLESLWEKFLTRSVGHLFFFSRLISDLNPKRTDKNNQFVPSNIIDLTTSVLFSDHKSAGPFARLRL